MDSMALTQVSGINMEATLTSFSFTGCKHNHGECQLNPLYSYITIPHPEYPLCPRLDSVLCVDLLRFALKTEVQVGLPTVQRFGYITAHLL